MTHTHFTQTWCIPGRLNMLRHFSELIWRGGAFCRGPPQWFWQSRHKKHYLPWGYDLPATSKQAVKQTLAIVHSPDKILVGEKVYKFINMLLHLNDFVAQHDTITYCNCESLKRAIIRCYLSVDTFGCFSDGCCFLDVNHFRKGSGQASAKPHAHKCFMWPRQFVLLSWGRKMGATKIGLCHLG